MNKHVGILLCLALVFCLAGGCTSSSRKRRQGIYRLDSKQNIDADASPQGGHERYVFGQTYIDVPWKLGPDDKSFEIHLAKMSETELWIIEKPALLKPPADADKHPGSGALIAITDKKEIPLPLKHTDVKAKISGYMATVDVTQQFHNPFSGKIEARYVFPLPQNAAVNDFIMTIGKRRIRGIIREREEAERIYHAARRQGHAATLLTQERPNIFTQSVANIEPGKRIDVTIKYFNTLAYSDGWYAFVFPTVVGPRFNPPRSRDGVGAVARGAHGVSGQRTEVQYLRPDERSGHDISIKVDLDASVSIEEIMSVNHGIVEKRNARSRAKVTLKPFDRIPNKDFILRYKVAGKKIKSSLMTHRDKRGGYFSLMVYPPDDLAALKACPVEMIFVLDCSGSMRGQPMNKAKTAMRRALRNLLPRDTFQIIRFSSNASRLGPEPLSATEENIRKGIAYVDSLRGSGGTMMIEGVKSALDFPHDRKRLRIVSFMTDGYIGNEKEIFQAIHERLGGARIFSFGVGASVNRYLLEGMARIGNGAVAYVGLDERAGKAVDAFYERIRHPAMTDIEVDWGSLEVSQSFPSRIPDLFVGRPVIITGRFKGRGKTKVSITGRAGGETKEMVLNLNLNERRSEHPGIPGIWARTKIRALESSPSRDAEIPDAIKMIALEYNLMSAYTAFVAVDSRSRTKSEFGTTVQVPVPVPEGVKYSTTVAPEGMYKKELER